MSLLLHVIYELVDAAGMRNAFEKDLNFHLRLEHEPYEPLVIEAWNAVPSYMGEKRHISIAHYYYENGDAIADPDIMMTDKGVPIDIQQVLGYTRILDYKEGVTQMNEGARRSVEQLMNTWARNIRAQGWIEVAQARRQGEHP